MRQIPAELGVTLKNVNVNLIKEIRSIVISVAVFIMLHYALTVGSNYLMRTPRISDIWLLWINIAAYSLYIISGALAGILSKKHFILVGSVTGICSAIVAITIFGVAGEDGFGRFAVVTNGIIFGICGGAISLYIGRRKKNNAKNGLKPTLKKTRL